MGIHARGFAAFTIFAGMALGGGIFAIPAQAADYSVTVSRVPAGSALVKLAPSSRQFIIVKNLAPNVSLRMFHCKTPERPAQTPKLCDTSVGARSELEGDPAGRVSSQVSIRINGEFFGMNPAVAVPAPPTKSQLVNCRKDSCTLYVLATGPDTGNSAFSRTWPTEFTSVGAHRKTDRATITLGGGILTGPPPALVVNTPTSFVVTMKSGLEPTLSSDKCSVSKAGTITALESAGTCTVLLTTTGGAKYKPFVATQAFQLTPA